MPNRHWAAANAQSPQGNHKGCPYGVCALRTVRGKIPLTLTLSRRERELRPTHWEREFCLYQREGKCYRLAFVP